MAPIQNEEIRSDGVHFQNVLRLQDKYVADYEPCPRDGQINAQTLLLLIQKSTIPRGIQQRRYGKFFSTQRKSKCKHIIFQIVRSSFYKKNKKLKFL